MSRSIVLEAPGQLVVREVPPPSAGAGEVVVRVAWAGICGSDVDLFGGQRPAPYARYPIVPGHEWAGIVEAVGDGVDPSLLARAVVGENIRPCSSCAPCARGDSQACDTGYDETGFTIDGAWSDLMVVPASLLHPLRSDANLRSAAGVEPAACAAVALQGLDLAPGSRVAVVGGGTIGLLCTQLLRPTGTEVVVVDPVAAKADLAVACGAAKLVGPAEAEAETSASFDVVIEAAGAIGSAELATALARRSGTVVLCGIPPDTDTITTVGLVSKNLSLRTVFGANRAAWRHAVASFAAGEIDPGLLVTHEVGLDEAGYALDLVASRQPGVGKVLLKP